MSKIEVVGLGALNMDYIYRVEHILDDGETVVEESTLSPGGSAANTIYGLAKLGVATGFTGAVGDDDDGKRLVQDFEKAGVDTSQIKVKPGVRTGSVLCLSDRLGRRSLYVTPSANNLLTIDDLDFTYISRAKMLHLSSFAHEQQFRVLLELVDRLDSSVKISFAPGTLHSTKGLEALTPILARTYILFANHHEIRKLTGQDIIPGAESCLKQGCHIVVVTLGQGIQMELGKGTGRRSVMAACYIRDVANEYVIEPASPDVEPVKDSTGAGDAFAAGFLYGLLNNKGLEVSGRSGNIIAQFCITKVGARAGLPTLGELSQRYQELYNKEL
jgi:ribokinase